MTQLPSSTTTPQYACLSQSTYCFGAYQVVPLRAEDMESIRVWRNEQMNALRQNAPLSAEDQRHYYQTVVQPLLTQPHPSQLLFSLLRDDHCIGYGGLVHMDWSAQRAEWSFLVDTRRHDRLELYRQDFEAFLTICKHILFEDLGFHRLTTETYDFRPYVVEALEANGFVLEGRLRDHVVIDGRRVDALLHGCLKEAWQPHPRVEAIP